MRRHTPTKRERRKAQGIHNRERGTCAITIEGSSTCCLNNTRTTERSELCCYIPFDSRLSVRLEASMLLKRRCYSSLVCHSLRWPSPPHHPRLVVFLLPSWIFLVFPACYLNVTWTEQKKNFRGGAASRRQYSQSFSNFRRGKTSPERKGQNTKRHGFWFNFLFLLVLQFVCCFTSFLFYSPVFIF